MVLSLGIVSLAVAADRGYQDSSLTAWAEDISRGGVSLGHWLALTRNIGRLAREQNDPAAGLARATLTRRGGSGLLSDLNELIEARNKIRHGAGPRTRLETEQSLRKVEDYVFSALSNSTFMSSVEWVLVDSLSWNPSSDDYAVTGLSLMGDHPDFEPTSFTSVSPLAKQLYLRTAEGESVPLEPFCKLLDCPQCKSPELYYPDRLKATVVVLKSLDRGHETEHDMLAVALRDRTKGWLDGSGSTQPGCTTTP